MYLAEECAEVSTLLCEGRESQPLAVWGRDTSHKGYWGQPIRTLVSFSPAQPWGALLQEGFKGLPFSWQSLDTLVKLDDFKEQLVRISEEMNRCASKSAAMCCCPQPGTIWTEEVLCDLGLDLGSRSPGLDLTKAEPDGGKNQALLFKLGLLWSWPGSIEWDSPELSEVQDQNREYMRHSDLQNLKDGKNPFLLPRGAQCMYYVEYWLGETESVPLCTEGNGSFVQSLKIKSCQNKVSVLHHYVHEWVSLQKHRLWWAIYILMGALLCTTSADREDRAGVSEVKSWWVVFSWRNCTFKITVTLMGTSVSPTRVAWCLKFL